MHPSLIFGQRPTEPDVTLDEFLTELYNHPRRFGLADRDIRDESGCCPICSLVQQKGLGRFPNHEALEVGKDILKISHEDCENIIFAADNGGMMYQKEVQELRQKLLRACKLA